MVQVSVDHYGWRYLTRPRFILYQKILDLLSMIKFNTILELGPGPGILSHTLKFLDKKVVTLDFDKNLKPDVLGDIRFLPFKAESFDVVLACQILEHIPYQKFLKVIEDVKSISKKYFLFSVPYNQHCIEFYLHLKILKWLYLKGFLNKFLEKYFPLYFYFGKALNTDFPLHEEHFWEIGYKDYPLSRVRNDLEKHYIILNEGRVMLAPYYYYFLCQKLS